MLVSSSMSIRERSSERAHFEILNAEHRYGTLEKHRLSYHHMYYPFKYALTSTFFSFVSAVILRNENSTIHIDAVIDPLSPSGQKLTPLLRVLQKQIQPSMRIVLNPVVSSYLLYFGSDGEGFGFCREILDAKGM